MENNFFHVDITLCNFDEAVPPLVIVLHLIPVEGLHPFDLAFHICSDHLFELECLSDKLFVKYPITYRVPILCYLLSQFAALSAAPLIESVYLAKIFLGLSFL